MYWKKRTSYKTKSLKVHIAKCELHEAGNLKSAPVKIVFVTEKSTFLQLPERDDMIYRAINVTMFYRRSFMWAAVFQRLGKYSFICYVNLCLLHGDRNCVTQLVLSRV